MKKYFFQLDVIYCYFFIVLLLFPVLLYSQNQRILSLEDGLIEDKCGYYDKALAKRQLQELGDHWGYGYDSLLIDLGKWARSPYVTVDSIGVSVQQRAIWQLTISSNDPQNEPRRTVFIHARTHPGEVQSWWVTDELINLLLSEDEFAQLVRRKCVFYIIPMYNPDGVELEYPRENAHGIDIESNWSANPVEPEVAVLRSRFTQLMASDAPIEIALNMHSCSSCKRYFVYHDAVGTSVDFTVLEKQFISGVRSYFMSGIQPWYYFVSWKNGTPNYYPESWFWLNFGEAVMALTYEDMNCSSAGDYDKTAYAILHGVADYLDLVETAVLSNGQTETSTFTLHQNYPNPVNLSNRSTLSTIIQYNLETPQNIRLVVYDILGRKIDILDQGFRNAGEHRVFYNAASLANGLYFYRLETKNEARLRQFSVIK